VRYAKVTDLDSTQIVQNGFSLQQLLMQGMPFAYLPFVHHALLAFSPEIQAFCSENGFDLYAKSDYRFMESAFKLLITHFDYKSQISI
jgi:hypothetical protein